MPHRSKLNRSSTAAGADASAPAASAGGSASTSEKPRGLIVFAHGNSFPGGCYEQLFRYWRQVGYEVRAVERFGHDPSFPITSNWPHLRDELLHFIAQAQHEERLRGLPLFLVGHSLGGLLSLMALCKRPGFAQGLVMLDSPVVTGWRAHSVHMMKATRLMPRVSPGKVAQRRRHTWPTREAVFEHLSSKSLFARWDARVLQDYLRCGFVERDGQMELAFDRDVEARIYNTLPHNLGLLLHRHPPNAPVAFLAGTQSREMRQAGTAASRRLARGLYRHIAGTHLFPMEHPEETARQVLELIAQMEQRPHL